MLQQVLKDMYIDPDVLAALNEEQKKILFLKMREEQVRRWKEREEKERNGGDPEPKRTKPKSANCKNVTWLLGRDGEVSAIVMGEEEKRGIASIIKNIGGGDITQTQNVTPKIKTDNPSIQSKQGKPEETSSSLPLPVSVSDPLKSTPELKVEVKSIGPAKVMSNGPQQKCVNVRSPPTCDNAKPPAVQKTQVEDPSKKSFLMAKPDSMKPSELVRAGQVRTLKEVFNAKGGTTPASRGVKPPLPNKPRHLCPTNF